MPKTMMSLIDVFHSPRYLAQFFVRCPQVAPKQHRLCSKFPVFPTKARNAWRMVRYITTVVVTVEMDLDCFSLHRFEPDDDDDYHYRVSPRVSGHLREV
jgi:hypothetical protein